MVPKESLVQKYLPANYSDTYKFRLKSTEFTPDDLMVMFWTKNPAFINFLFKVRNVLVKPFGLNTDKTETSEMEATIRAGKENSMASFPDKTETETIMCLNDKHLKAYFSIFVEEQANNQKDVYLTTVVHMHNWLGYAYFYPICPFHHLVVKLKVKQLKKEIDANYQK